MKTILIRYCGRLSLTALCAVAAGCGPGIKEYKPDSKAHAYIISYRQTPPQRVYNRLRWVNSPDLLPSKELPESAAQRIEPVYHVQLKSTPVDEAALIIAGTARYTSRCSSSDCKQKVSINSLGTTEELAEELARQSGMRVVVDDTKGEIRVGGRGTFARKGPEAVAPDFFDKDDLQKEADEQTHTAVNQEGSDYQGSHDTFADDS